MKVSVLLTCLLLSVAFLSAAPVAAPTPDHLLKADLTRSFIEVDVKSTAKNFTARLDNYEAKLTADDSGKVKSAIITFKFTDLKTGETERDVEMIKWLGGGSPDGRFDLGILAVAPDGQGQVTGKLTMHGETQMVEFPVNVLRTADTFVVNGGVTIDYRNWGLKVIKKVLVLKVDPELRVRFKLTAATPDTSSLVKP